MNSRFLLLMSLSLATITSAVSGQGVMTPPQGAIPSRTTVDEYFPLADKAITRLEQPFRAESKPDWKIVRLMAELSFISYEDSISTVQNRLRLYDLVLGEFVTVDNHHFITAWDKERDVLIIAFRGTDIAQLADVWTDLDYAKTKIDIGEVHKGFYDASGALLRSVSAAIEHRGRPRHVWLTGHSLGGAIATLTMWRMESSGQPIDGLITFGQPRVGDRTFTEALNRKLGSRILRVINEDDVVVSLPPRIPLVLPAYYSGGNAIQFLDGELKQSGGVRLMAKPPIDGAIGDGTTPQVDLDLLAPETQSGKVPPDPEPLTAEQFEELKQILNDRDGSVADEPTYGGPLGGPMDRLDLKRRAGNHPMHLYIQNIERFAAEGK